METRYMTAQEEISSIHYSEYSTDKKGNFSTNQFLYKPIIPQTNDKEEVRKEEIVMKNI